MASASDDRIADELAAMESVSQSPLAVFWQQIGAIG